MISSIDKYLISSEIQNWYDFIGKDYEDFHSPVFQVFISIKFDKDSAIITIAKENDCILSVFPEDVYESLSDEEILNYILDKIYEIIK